MARIRSLYYRQKSYVESCRTFQPPGDEHWHDKSELQAINSVNKTLSGVVKDQLFRFMTLKYSYDFDRGMMQ
jgi:hypothetical protein